MIARVGDDALATAAEARYSDAGGRALGWQSMTTLTIEQLAKYGPDRCESLAPEQARAMCRRLATGRYENFSVLSAVVPADVRDDFAAVYAFCRWADDLGDESGGPDRALPLLDWWRCELRQCFDGQPRHPVFVALWPTICKHDLPIQPFEDLIRAFEQDQSTTRYETWEQLLDYCRLSANPVGRLVLMVCGEGRDESRFGLSDATCTALQLTNHWQDVRRDALQRDRVYLPRVAYAAAGVSEDFEQRMLASARQGFGVDQRILGEYRTVLTACVQRTWTFFERGDRLLDDVSDRTRPVAWLLAAGGQHVLRQIERWNHETIFLRPTLSVTARLGLVGKAWWMARRARKASGRP